MYLMFVDESGTHAGSQSFVLGGVAIHEADVVAMQRGLERLVQKQLGVPAGIAEGFELHAAEMRNAKKPDSASAKQVSPWAALPRAKRLGILQVAYEYVANFRPSNADLPVALFGVVLDRAFHGDWTAVERERFAYEVLLNKFDVMLKRARRRTGSPNRGLVIHDRRVVAERDIQTWTAEWRSAAGRVGQLRNLADVPLFADSRATRLLQVADLVAYALFRHYDPTSRGWDYFGSLWDQFDAHEGVTHGCVHYSPSYGQGACVCLPCDQRLKADSLKLVGS